MEKQLVATSRDELFSEDVGATGHQLNFFTVASSLLLLLLLLRTTYLCQGLMSLDL